MVVKLARNFTESALANESRWRMSGRKMARELVNVDLKGNLVNFRLQSKN